MTMTIDWGYLQSFIAVAEGGSLSAAARALGASQPTMGRHIALLEKELGLRLFDRVTGGLELTETGIELLDYAQQMATSADHFSLRAAGRSETIAGTVRITASEIVAAYVLPEILTDLRQAEAEIDIELVASDRTENLLKREADIAVRMYRPTQNDVITRHVGDLQTGMFAARDYLARRGVPDTLADFQHHDVIGYDRSDLIIQGFRAAGLEVDREFFAFRSDNQIVAWRMVVAGFGIGFNQIQVGQAEARVQQLFVDTPLPTLPIWLTAHADLKTSRRVRRVYDFLAARLGQINQP
jgi:DNA-binding transcriptional LysR family regulator